MNHPELLIPAGNLEKLRTAVLYGANAVYAGVEGLSLRARQAEFSLADLEVGVREAHRKGVKVFAALNIFARNRDLEAVAVTLNQLAEMKIDGVIISDPGVLKLVKKVSPDIKIHLSTQANTTNVEAVRFWREQGVSRIVLARELSLPEMAEIAALVPGMELEMFVHGAMCMALSGRCLLSAYRNGRSSNQGDCTHPCRWEYQLVESIRPNDPFTLEEDRRYSFLLSSKDLRMIEHLPEILAAGVTSLKIEGRMKSAYYVAVVTRTYRWALNAAMEHPAGFTDLPEWLAELDKISNRGYTTGFYFSAGEKVNEISPDIKYIQTHDLVGTVIEYDSLQKRILVGARNRITASDELELLLPDDTIRLEPAQMTDTCGSPVFETHNSYQVWFPLGIEVPEGAVIRRKIKE
jgi:U32 family peptidase